VSLRILRTGGGVSYAGAGTSTSLTSVAYIPGNLVSGPFATKLPIRIGDHVGLDASIAVAFMATFTPNWGAAGVSSEYVKLRKKLG
jgi:hypothetical protein